MTLPRTLVHHPHVRREGNGSPFVAGSRVPVRRLWAWYRGGTTAETLFRRYPNLGPGKVLDAISFALDNVELMEADLAQETALLANPPAPSRQLKLPYPEK